MRDIEDFDLDRSIDEGWDQFVVRLAEVLSVMDEGATLTLSALKGDADRPRIVFTCPTLGEISAEVVGVQDASTLTALGWPDPLASRSWSQEHTERLAQLSVTILRDLVGVTHPVFLTTDDPEGLLETPAPDVAGETTSTRTGAERAAVAVMARDQADLDGMVSIELAAVFGHEPVRDSDGDHAIRVGSAMIFVRVVPDCREIIVFSPLVHEVSGRSRAAEVLNDLNAESRWVRFALIRDRVFGSMSVLAQPFVPAHLQQAVRELADIADAIDENLAATLKGRTTF